MDFFEAIEKRRSIRKFKPEPVDHAIIDRAFDAAVLAPNSSNIQTWDFYWVQTPDLKSKLVEYCMGQSAARTAADLVVFVADPNLWKRSIKRIQAFTEKVHAPKPVLLYYSKLIPITFRPGFLNSLALVKWLLGNIAGIFRPMLRGPHFKKDLQEVAIKSAALAAENFVLALSAQGIATCMMEGHDECRVKKLLNLPRSARIVMVIAIGHEAERGTWGPRFRIPTSEIIHRI